jgi:hypothetical protein
MRLPRCFDLRDDRCHPRADSHVQRFFRFAFARRAAPLACPAFLAAARRSSTVSFCARADPPVALMRRDQSSTSGGHSIFRLLDRFAFIDNLLRHVTLPRGNLNLRNLFVPRWSQGSPVALVDNGTLYPEPL